MTSVTAAISITSDRVEVDLEPDAGGRCAQLRVDGVPILIGRDDVPAEMRLADGSVRATDWGSYPMVPWAGRIRHGRFVFEGTEYQLPINFGAHAIHGVGFESSWTVTRHDPDRLRLELELPSDDRWPFGGRVAQEITVDDAAVRFVIEVTADERPFHVSFGWHPWFRKPERLDFAPDAMYRRDDEGIAVDELVPVPPGPWDDCFVNHVPVGLTVDGVRLRLSSDCTTWVVYDERAHATCVEPQTAPPDAFTIAPLVLGPGRSHRAWFRLETDT